MAILSFTTQFTLTSTPKTFAFNDTSDYAGQGISTANVNGNFEITSPSGTIIHNNLDFSNGGCDINIASQTILQTTISLPVDTLGNVEQGTYIIKYTVYDKNLLLYYTQTNTITFNYSSPIVSINNSYDCYAPLFKSIDATNYVVNTLTPAITRTHTLEYPGGSAGDGHPTITTGAVISTSTFYGAPAPNGVQTTIISSVLTYTVVAGVNGFTIVDQVVGSKAINVDCTDSCALLCCITKFEERMRRKQGVNDIEYASDLTDFNTIMAYKSLISALIECGLGDSIGCYLSIIKNLSHCTDACKCSNQKPMLVQGLGQLIATTSVATCGYPLAVVTTTAGGDTVYTLCIDPSWVAAINGLLYETEVLGRNFITVTDSGVSGGVRTWTIDGEETDVISADTSVIVTQVYFTSGVLVTGKKYEIINFASGDDFTNLGAVNANGNIFVATGTTPTTWTHGSTVNAIGLQVLNLAVSLKHQRNETDFNTPFNVSDANNQAVTGATLTIPSGGAGDYDISFEADIYNSTTGAAQLLKYRLVKTGNTALSLDREINCTVDAGNPLAQNKMVCNAQVALAVADVINVNVDTTSANFVILGRSIKIIKLSN